MGEIIETLNRLGHYEIADELESLKDDMILDVYNFKRELQRQGLWTEELEIFITNYMRWDNK